MLDFDAGNRIDLEVGLARFGEKILIRHGRRESVAQRRNTIGRHIRRRQIGPAHYVAGKDHFEDLPLLVGLREVQYQRHVRQFRMLLQRELDEHNHALVFDPGPVRRFHARPRPAAASLHLAALHRQNDVVAARIAFDDLKMRAEHAVEHTRELIGIGAGAGATDGQVFDEEILEFCDAGLPQSDANADLVIGAADPVELLRVEGVALADQQRIEGNAAADRADCGTIVRRDAIKVIGEAKTAGAFEIFRHNRGTAGDMRAEMPADHPRIKVIGAADAIADIEIDGAAFVEVCRALCQRVCARRNEARDNRERGADNRPDLARRRCPELMVLARHSSPALR